MPISDQDLTRSLYNALHRYYCTIDLDWDPEAEEFQIITTPVAAEPYLEEILQERLKAEQDQERKARNALAKELSVQEWLAGARSGEEAMDLLCEYQNCRYGEDALEEDERALELAFAEDPDPGHSAMAMLAELSPEQRRAFERFEHAGKLQQPEPEDEGDDDKDDWSCDYLDDLD